MHTFRSALIAAVVASSAAFAASGTALAAPDGSTVRADVMLQISHRDRYDDRRHNRRHWHHRRCYTDIHYRHRFGHRVRVIERICFDRYGRRYVVDRHVVRVGHRHRHF